MQKLLPGMLLIVLAISSCDIPLNADIGLPSPEIVAASPTKPPSAMEKSIHQQINQYRQSRKLPPLTLDARISAQAKIHSQNMASGKVPFSHDGFDARVSVIRRQISYRAAAENVAFNQGYPNPAEQAVDGWIKSDGHRVNIVGQYNLTGIGVVKNAKNEYYFTQLFINRR
ncbi:CAP domain-containing protein [Synechocystis sp. PCC 7509]|uniref:CAP domain-containing protein n=1 Tax=Synechocystis sp. PCC 7509 TaxID=927677 RepID=UPI0002AC3C4E|nr:CAP domain-containing protein [Synechocystis sp. PCC 7509]